MRSFNGLLRDRVLARTDYPMLDPKQWREEFDDALVPQLKPDLEKRILEANARRFLGS